MWSMSMMELQSTHAVGIEDCVKMSIHMKVVEKPGTRHGARCELLRRRLRPKMSQWKGCACLQRLDRDIAANLAYHRQVQQLADEELLVGGEIGHDDFQKIVRFA